MAKLTEWYPGHIKPVRVGVYERDYGPTENGESIFCHWNGKRWSWGGNSVDDVQRAMSVVKEISSGRQSLPWRGLASDPEKGGE